MLTIHCNTYNNVDVDDLIYDEFEGHGFKSYYTQFFYVSKYIFDI